MEKRQNIVKKSHKTVSLSNKKSPATEKKSQKGKFK